MPVVIVTSAAVLIVQNAASLIPHIIARR